MDIRVAKPACLSDRLLRASRPLVLLKYSSPMMLKWSSGTRASSD